VIAENISIIIVIIGTIIMALAVDTESFLHDNMKGLSKELKKEGPMVPAGTMVRKWPCWYGLFLIVAGTALRWNYLAIIMYFRNIHSSILKNGCFTLYPGELTINA